MRTSLSKTASIPPTQSHRVVIGWIAICVAVAMALIVSCGSARQTMAIDYHVQVVDPTINNQCVRPGVPLPSTCLPGSELRIAACRGVYEPASFVVETPARLTKVAVRVGELSRGAHVIGAQAVDVRACEPVFRRITDLPGTVNWLLLHDPTLVELRDEPQPAALKQGASETDRAYVRTNHIQSQTDRRAGPGASGHRRTPSVLAHGARAERRGGGRVHRGH